MAKVIIVLEDDGVLDCSIKTEVLEQPDGPFSLAMLLSDAATPVLLKTKDEVVRHIVSTAAEKFADVVKAKQPKIH